MKLEKSEPNFMIFRSQRGENVQISDSEFRKNRKEYYTYKLVESIRTGRGPRQRDILNIGVDFELPKEQWKDLANCVEEILTGQRHLNRLS